jgi:hypothetical protein
MEKKREQRNLTLRIADQETARVVAIQNDKGHTFGAGCLISSKKVMTCKHVVQDALGKNLRLKKQVSTMAIQLIGVTGNPSCVGKVIDFPSGKGPENDLCLLEIEQLEGRLRIEPVEFITTLRHGQKSFSVLGFRTPDPLGRNAVGRLHAADARGLIQMDCEGALPVSGGYSGAPVWSSDLGAFIGLVRSEISEESVAWCIPSNLIARFYSRLIVRFCIPLADRPLIHDYREDDPNVQLFGRVSRNDTRRLRAKVRKARGQYRVDLEYHVLDGNETCRGRYVTFVTHPSFTRESEDAYELFSRLKSGVAKTHFWCMESFTVAAIADAGDTALTVDLSRIRGRPKGFK